MLNYEAREHCLRLISFRSPLSRTAAAFGYTGQVWLPELGAYYYKARIYNPALGRFMQTDPIGYGDGLNLYAYVKGDPVNLVDPLGLEECVAGGTGDDCEVTVSKSKGQINAPATTPGPLGASRGWVIHIPSFMPDDEGEVIITRVADPLRPPCKTSACGKIHAWPSKPSPSSCNLANNFCGPKPLRPKQPQPEKPIDWKRVRTCLGAGAAFAAGAGLAPETLGGSLAVALAGAAAIQTCAES